MISPVSPPKESTQVRKVKFIPVSKNTKDNIPKIKRKKPINLNIFFAIKQIFFVKLIQN